MSYGSKCAPDGKGFTDPGNSESLALQERRPEAISPIAAEHKDIAEHDFTPNCKGSREREKQRESQCPQNTKGGESAADLGWHPRAARRRGLARR